MIVTCPACETRYVVDDAALGGAAGRRLRCASCGNSWRYSPEQEAIHEALAETAAGAHPHPPAAAPVGPAAPNAAAAASDAAEERAEPHLEPPVLEGPALSPLPAVDIERPAGIRPGVVAGGLALLAVAALVLVAMFGRDRIVALWPAAGQFYAAFSPADRPGTGLNVSVTPTRTTDGLVIDGDIVNNAPQPRPIPRLRVTLRDGNKADLESRVIAPPVAQLGPGATAHFNTTFEHPSITATGVAVTFATN